MVELKLPGGKVKDVTGSISCLALVRAFRENNFRDEKILKLLLSADPNLAVREKKPKLTYASSDPSNRAYSIDRWVWAFRKHGIPEDEIEEILKGLNPDPITLQKAASKYAKTVESLRAWIKSGHLIPVDPDLVARSSSTRKS